jgi:hypothetical protein
MTRTTQQNLESCPWGAAVLLRGTIDAEDYKQFIFSPQRRMMALLLIEQNEL